MRKLILTPEQREALRDFAKNNGRYWKQELNTAWFYGREPGPSSHLLRQIRNNLGPTWLTNFRLSEHEDEEKQPRSPDTH